MYIVNKFSDMHTPGPAETWYMMDENADSIDDGIMYTSTKYTNGIGAFVEIPSSDHNNACGMVYGDGHSEIHKWRDNRTLHVVNYTTFTLQAIAGTPSQDLSYLSYATPLN